MLVPIKGKRKTEKKEKKKKKMAQNYGIIQWSIQVETLVEIS